jgi:hypothetical protein
MQAVFIRHNPTTTDEILKDLWERCLIAIHYKNTTSINPDDYEGQGRYAIKRLLGYCETGAVVGATFKKIKPNQILVGLIASGTQIIGTDEYGPEYVYKTVQLVNTKVISYIDYPLLAAIQPRGATITGWPSGEKCLQSIMSQEAMEPEVDSLAPGQLEVLCYEYLRSMGIIKALLLPIGRTLLHVDIYGIDEDGNNVIAQVTHGRKQSDVDRKLKILKEYTGRKANFIFFGPVRFRREIAEIKYISIEEVFSTLHSGEAGTIYQLLITKMQSGFSYSHRESVEGLIYGV